MNNYFQSVNAQTQRGKHRTSLSFFSLRPRFCALKIVEIKFIKLFTVLLCAFFFFACFACDESKPPAVAATAAALERFPRVVLWAWERPENLEFAEADKYAVAFLAQTLELRGEEVIVRPRRQPLKVNPAAKLFAVTRIEAGKINRQKASLSAEQQKTVVENILKTLELKNVSAIQIDFDAAVSERLFYRQILKELRGKMPSETPLVVTALASACFGDRWMENLPVSEAVPMLFRMGADDENIREILAAGADFTEPLCRTSYGIATDESLKLKFEPSRRIYIFNTRAWTKENLARTILNLKPKD
jgi:hypothetical protein